MSKAATSLGVLLTRRLALIAVALALLNLVAVLLRYHDAPSELTRSALHRELDDLIDALPPLPYSPRIATAARADYEDYPQAYAFAIFDEAGRTIDAANPSLMPQLSEWSRPVSAMDATFLRDGSLLLASAVAVQRGDAQIHVVVAMAHDPKGWRLRAMVDELITHVALPMIPLVLLLIGANAALVRRAMVPVVVAAAWARTLRPGAHNQPLPRQAKMPEEIDALVDAIDRALARLDSALSAERRRSAEAAHALRTPLAVIQARIDGLPEGVTEEALKREVRILARTVQQLLSAATADTAAAPGLMTIDLASHAAGVVAQLAPFAHAHGVGLELIVHPEGAGARADAGAVEVALINLVENAVLHGGADVEIEAGPGPLLVVRDSGPGLSDAFETLSEPFRRGATAAPGGAGLGLAIVQRVMAAQEGRVEAFNRPEGGTEFQLHFLSPRD